MADSVTLNPTRCAICMTEGNATEMYAGNFSSEAFSATVFSARRTPDRIHYRVVKCKNCGLVRSDPVATAEDLARIYSRSGFSYGDEVSNLRLSYGRRLAELDAFGARKGDLLEIGCGNGFFLEEALDQGYRTVRGVEPSASAIEMASSRVRSQIVCGLMRPGLFEPNQFDVVCLFQVFDHVPDPVSVLQECFRILRPQGLLLCVNHNVEALSARLLGERSPIVDIEHTYLYSPRTIARLLAMHGFEVRHIGRMYNRYTLQYLFRLTPLPAGAKRPLLGVLERTGLGRIPLTIPLGNLTAVAQKAAPSNGRHL